MLNSFRRFTKSRYGLIAVFVFLAVIALAFAAGDITGVRSNTPGSAGNVVAKVGDREITDRQVRERIDLFLRNLQQQQGQPVTMEQFLAQGGLELALDEMISAEALVAFAEANGMKVSKKLVDGEIASNPAFQGIDGKFSQQTFEQLLAQNRILPAAFRESLTNERYSTWLVNRASIGGQMPNGVLLPYASLLLERRQGIVGLVASAGMDPGPDPDQAKLTAFYNTKRAAYMVPQRRVVRYAVVSPQALQANSAATEAEIADAYRKAGRRFAAAQKRTVELVTALDQATATTIANAAKTGALPAAASAAGLEARTLSGVEKAALAQQTSPQLADAAFAAQPNALSGPTRVGANWYVFKVTAVEQVAARSLDQARAELATEISQRKLAQALGNLRQSIEDGIGDNKTFDEIVAGAKLQAQRTPALAANGGNPDDPAFKPDPAVAAVIRAGFGIEQTGDEPVVAPIAPDGTFAVVGLQQIVQAAPRPLAQIRDRVVKDYLLDQALKKARAAASGMIAKLERGMPMEQALAEAGVTKAPPPKPFDFRRQEILGREIAPHLQMAFSMAPKKAKIVEGQNREGFYVVYLNAIEEKSAASDPAAIARVKADITPQVGPESARQFVNAIRDHLKVTRNEAAINALRAELTRSGSAR